MLLRIKIRNFLSFFDETVFDMFPNPKRISFPNHIYGDMTVPLLKQAAIYGANGSGKSNFIKAIGFIKSFVTHEDFLKNVDLDEYIFQLAPVKQSKINFEIEFFIPDSLGAVVIVDGQDIYEIPENESIKIKIASKKAKLIHRRERNYFEVLNKKLQWGN